MQMHFGKAKFRKIMPVEYRRALNELKAAAIAAE